MVGNSKKLLKVGSTFKGVTLGKRVITLAKVIDHDPVKGMHTRWFDDNGKHYEWFHEHEFSEFEVIHSPPEVSLCQIQ